MVFDPAHFCFITTIVNQDLNIYYTGGSGGFVFLHLLMLSKKFVLQYYMSEAELLSFRKQLLAQADFVAWLHTHMKLSDYDYASLQQSDWPCYTDYVLGRRPPVDVTPYVITAYASGNQDLIYSREQECDFLTQAIVSHQWRARTRWKSTEIWPNNELTHQAPSTRPRIFFHCNSRDSWLASPGLKVMLYTDVRTQLRMCSYKSAGMFFDTQGASKFSIHRQHLQTAVHDPLTHCEIDTWAAGDTQHADVLVRLQDLINCPEQVLSKFGVEITPGHQQLLQHWVDQHPLHLLNKCGILTK